MNLKIRGERPTDKVQREVQVKSDVVKKRYDKGNCKREENLERLSQIGNAFLN